MYFNLFQIHHMDYLDPDFAKLKYTYAYLLLIQRGQSHLDSHTDLISTWLHPKIFYYWIKNSDSLTSKYSELLANYHSNLKSEGHLYPYPSRVTLDRRVFRVWSYSMMMYSYISPACHISIFIPFGHKDNQHIWYTMIYTWYRYCPSNSVWFDHE